MNWPNHPPAIRSLTVCPFEEDPGGYVEVIRTERLPAASTSPDRTVMCGYATDIGSWYFFDSLEPALALGRHARMSPDCTGYGVFEAAVETVFCTEHFNDERHLYYTGEELSRGPGAPAR
jgi:hypothetical protein